MDYTMNNQSLDELVKRDKKLGRVAGKVRNQGPGNKGKKPNKMQQQRNQASAARQGGNKQNQKMAQQQANNRQPARIKNRGAGIFKQKNAPAGNQNRNNRNNKAGKVVRTSAQGGKGRIMNNSVKNKRQQRQNNSQQTTNNSRSAIAQRRIQALKQKALKRGGRVNNAFSKNNNQQQQLAQKKTLSLKKQPVQKLQPPQGRLDQRKLKVRNIDANNVTVTDLNKLFSKCGVLINANFDKNMHGQYLGSATLVYHKSSSAAAAIKQYNNAQLDDRVMKIEYALPQAQVTKNVILQTKNSKKPQPMGMRRGANAIKKRDGSGQQSAQKSKRNQLAAKTGGQKRGLGARRPKGKTLSIKPSGAAAGNSRRQRPAGGAALRKKPNSARK